MKLQINTSGAWKDVVKFDSSRRAEVIKAVGILADILGRDASWCIVDDAGKREWLRDDLVAEIEVNIQHIGRCCLPVLKGVVIMPDVTVRDIISKACVGGG